MALARPFKCGRFTVSKIQVSNVRNLKGTEEEDLKMQSLLLKTDLSVILTTLTEWSVATKVL